MAFLTPRQVSRMADRHGRSIDRGKINQLRHAENRKKFMNDKVLFQCFHGDAPVGKPCLMTGQEAYLRNIKHEERYYQSLGVNSAARLIKWRRVTPEEWYAKKQRRVEYHNDPEGYVKKLLSEENAP